MISEQPNFVHLNVHTEYSLFGSIIRIEDLVERVREMGMKAVAITDDGVMYGVMDFYRTMVRAGIKPIIGCDCYLAPRTMADNTLARCREVTHLTLLAENMEGYGNLCCIATFAAVSGFYQQPRVDSDVLQQYSRGLICLSGGMQSDIARLVQEGTFSAAWAAARYYKEVFGEDSFYLEIQNTGLAGQAEVNQALREMSRDLSIPMVGTNCCRYLNPGDSRFLEILLCQKADKTIDDPDRPRVASDQLYVKSAGKMISMLAGFPGAAENTVAIAERCNVEFDFTTYHLPRTRLEAKAGRSAIGVLKEKAGQGLEVRLAQRRHQEAHIDENIYRARLDHELAKIQQAGIAGYFLLVAEIVDFAMDNNIPIGPGRGATPGCLACYCLGITAIDPVAHGLLFERFFNSLRPVMPDIDLDVCIRGREKVVQHLLDTYNAGDFLQHRASHIITFGAMKTRHCVREVARVLSVSKKKAETIIRLIPPQARDLADALAQVPTLEKQMDGCSDHGETLKQAVRKLEGLPRHPAIHQAGIVVGDQPLTRTIPLSIIRGKVATQFTAWQVESMGLIILDLLGLRHLTIINDTLALIKEQGKTPPDMCQLDMADEQTFQLLGRGDTDGVFQLAAAGIRELLIKMKPDAFSDIVTLIGLYRPGPLEDGVIDDFIDRKHGRKEVAYPVPGLEPFLKETYGLPLYQEQIMRIVQDLAGFSPEQSDSFRRAVGKKIVKEMEAFRRFFINGLTTGGTAEDTARELYEQLEFFAGYGFHKSHSTAYALIAYQSAYLKAHFRDEFMAQL
ncbi:MAG: DNA polymerase III subunit alpha [Thermodesulfobacteriota bacterium]